MTEQTQSVEQLREEFEGIDSFIEAAAVDEDFMEWSRLAMRRDALPALIREAEARPIRDEIEQLEEELESIFQERQRIFEEEPTVPAGMRRYVTPAVVRNRLLGGITERATNAGRALDAKRAELAQIEERGPTAIPT